MLLLPQAIQNWADARYLNDTGDIVGGDSINTVETGGNVILDIDLAANGGLESTSRFNDNGQLRVDDGNGIVVNSTGVNVGQGTGITVNTNDVAVTQVNIWGQAHDHSKDVSGDMSGVGDMTFTSGKGDVTGVKDITFDSTGGNINTTGNEDIHIESNGSGALDIDRNTSIDGTLNVTENADFDKNVNITGDLDVKGSLTFPSLTLTGDLTVEGNTTLGNDASDDTVTINADTTLTSGSTLQIDSTSTSDNTHVIIQAPSEFQSSGGASGHNQTYTLPVKAPTNGQVLTSQSDGTLSWGPGGGGSGGATQDLSLDTAKDSEVGINISDGGTGVVIPAAENKSGGAGVMTKAQVQKLDSISANAEVNVDTNITVTEKDSVVTIDSSTGSGDDIQGATTTKAGVMTKDDYVRFSGLPANAAGDINFGDLDDVTITSVSTGQIPRWNGSNWVNTEIFSGSTVLKFIGVVDAKTTGPGDAGFTAYADVNVGDFWVHNIPTEPDDSKVAGTAKRDQSVPSGWTTIDNPGSGSETDGVDPLGVVRGSMIVAGLTYTIGGTVKRNFMILGGLNAGTIAAVAAGDGITVSESGGVATVALKELSPDPSATTVGDASNVAQVTVNKFGQVTKVESKAIDKGVTSVSPGTGISVTTTGGTATVNLANTYTASTTYNNATITTDANGVIETIASGTDDNDNTTYDIAISQTGTGTDAQKNDDPALTLQATNPSGKTDIFLRVVVTLM